MNFCATAEKLWAMCMQLPGCCFAAAKAVPCSHVARTVVQQHMFCRLGLVAILMTAMISTSEEWPLVSHKHPMHPAPLLCFAA
jgi:hypothetical protein